MNTSPKTRHLTSSENPSGSIFYNDRRETMGLFQRAFSESSCICCADLTGSEPYKKHASKSYVIWTVSLQPVELMSVAQILPLPRDCRESALYRTYLLAPRHCRFAKCLAAFLMTSCLPKFHDHSPRCKCVVCAVVLLRVKNTVRSIHEWTIQVSCWFRLYQQGFILS